MKADGVPVPEFFTSLDTADRSVIYIARTILNGSAGAGIVVVRPEDQVSEAPLYTKYIQKLSEIRVHVAFGRAIFAQEKRKVAGREQDKDEKLIRNYDNGWVFCPIDVPEDLASVAINTCKSLGLDFGAVDIVRDKRSNSPYVLECNTAPGLSSPGLIEAYTQAFKEQITW